MNAFAIRSAAAAIALALAAPMLAAPARAEAAAAAIPYGESLMGDWSLHCCGNSYLWRLTVTEDDGVNFKGRMYNLKYANQGPDGDITGHRLGGGRFYFDRTIPGGGQRWTGEFHGLGLARSMTGRWGGTGSDMGASLDFHAERPNAAAAEALSGPGAPIPQGQSLTGAWTLHCCGDSYLWTMTITDDNGVNFRGGLVNLRTGEADGVIAGRRVGGGAVEFDRTGGGGSQHWTAYLDGSGSGQRMYGGHWSGLGSDMGVPLDFHAERPAGAATTGSPATSPGSAASDTSAPDTSAPDTGAPPRDDRGPTSGPAVTLYETWNSDGCGFTDTAPLTLDAPARLDQIQLWYNWRGGETSVAFTLSSGGREITSGVLQRGACDPYQAAWCVAESAIGAELEPGDYQVRLASARDCQNPASQGRGFIKALGRPD